MPVRINKAPAPKPLKNVEEGEWVQSLFEEASTLAAVIEDKQAELHALWTKIAHTTCPYEAGVTVRTESGLGARGLVVQEVMPAKYPSKLNPWAIRTVAIGKDGRVTNRGRTLEALGNGIVT